MKFSRKWACAALFLAAGGLPALFGQGAEPGPVTPNASPEARALLGVLRDISGKYILTGQHNNPNIRDRNTRFAARYTGRTPVIWGTDMGHAADGTDSILARPDIVREAIRQNRLGSIVAICWHAAPPTANEPVTFQPLPGSDPNALASVQGRLLDRQFQDVLTPGTDLYRHWCAQVDDIAFYLKQLQDAHVPVLWRPYHEMNGSWFWWGGRTGTYSTIALYRQIFDRLVNHHHLNNLIWVWSMDRITRPEMAYENFFPGIQYVDVLGLDVYGGDFAQSYYDSLERLSQGKPIALAEVGTPPPPEVLNREPRFAYYMTWSGMVRNTTRRQYDVIFGDPRYLSLEDPAYGAAIAPYREAAGLPPLRFETRPADFSGTWVLDEDKSTFGRFGEAAETARMEIVERDNTLAIRRTRIPELEDDQVTEEKLSLDGTPSNSVFMDSPRVTTARAGADGRTLLIDSVVSLARFRPGAKITSKEVWSLSELGQVLSIKRTAASPRGEENSTLVFDRR
jgi:mannan endo-1,4-beta-mannosidase